MSYEDSDVPKATRASSANVTHIPKPKAQATQAAPVASAAPTGGCRVCKKAKHELLRIRARYLSGENTEKIACDIGVKFNEANYHFTNCIKIAPSRFERISELVKQLSEDVKTAKEAYEEDTTQADMLNAYMGAVKTYKDTILALDKIVKPEEHVNAILAEVINPLIKNTIVSFMEKGARFSQDMVSSAGADPAKTEHLRKVFIREMSEQIKEISSTTTESLKEYFGVADEALKKLDA
jgi:hypothetical protein